MILSPLRTISSTTLSPTMTTRALSPTTSTISRTTSPISLGPVKPTLDPRTLTTMVNKSTGIKTSPNLVGSMPATKTNIPTTRNVVFNPDQGLSVVEKPPFYKEPMFWVAAGGLGLALYQAFKK